MQSNALLYAIGAMVAWGFWGILANHSLNERSPTSVLVVTYAIALLCMAIMDPRFEAHMSKAGLATAIGAGLMLALGSLFFYRALTIGQLAIVPAIAGLYFLISTLYGVFVLDEHISTVNIFGVILACIAIYLMSR